MSSAIAEYGRGLAQEIEIEAEATEAEALLPEVFCSKVIEKLIEIGEIEEAWPRSHRDRGVQVAGYGIEDGDVLNLITVDYRHGEPGSRIGQRDVETLMRRLRGFWEACRDRPYHDQLEESSDAWDMALDIHERAASIRRIDLHLLTNRIARVEYVEPRGDNGVEIREQVWDLERLWRIDTEGARGEPVEIDLVRELGEPLPVLKPIDGGDYRAYFTVFPGEFLAGIYAEHGPRLLERNVRSFLQFTGKINKGIRQTIKEQPEHFLAFNNGISATASRVTVVPLSDGGLGISELHDLQIVNGGQTTASITRSKQAGVDVSRVMVQAKITEVDGEILESLVPRISEYANSQNKVSIADLSSNHPFHIEVEALSRSVWAPASAQTEHQTIWFYERARGQYSDTLNRQHSQARRREFKRRHPSPQRISKTDLAKYEHAWGQLPHEVSRGAQKNFTAFMTRLDQRPFKPDVAWWQRLVAKAILWKKAERIVSAQDFGGYRANIVAYSIAKLSHSTQQRLDLGRIWTAQALDDVIEKSIEELAHLAFGLLTSDKRPTQNVTEWAKRDTCWRAMKDVAWDVPTDLGDLMVPIGRAARDPEESGDEASNTMAGALPEDDPQVREMSAIPGDVWLGLSSWARQTSNLSGWDRRFAYTIGIHLKRGRALSARQAPIANRILEEAREFGFDPAALNLSSGSGAEGPAEDDGDQPNDRAPERPPLGRDANRAWIFQGNPRLWDLGKALGELGSFDWVVRQHRKKVHKGDRVYLWEAGPQAGILATATVMDDPTVRTSPKDQRKYALRAREFDAPEHRVRLRIETVLSERLPKSRLVDHPRLSQLSILRSPTGTNFAVSADEFFALEALLNRLDDSAA
jgi:hypothetical protein